MLLRRKGRCNVRIGHGWPVQFFCGGGVAPVLLMWGLSSSWAASASLLLNLEGVLTTLVAGLLFREATPAWLVANPDASVRSLRRMLEALNPRNRVDCYYRAEEGI